ncbi:ABC transporter substrate-binding protein [Parafrankia sp. FMc6]
MPGEAWIGRVVRQMLADNIDTLVSAVDISHLAPLVAAARQAGVPLKVILSGSAVNAEVLGRYGPLLAGVTSFSRTIPFQAKSPSLDAYRAAVAQYAPQLTDPDQTVALTSFVIADMLIRGLEEAGECPTRQSFIDGLRAVDDYDAGGLISRTDIDGDFGRTGE